MARAGHPVPGIDHPPCVDGSHPGDEGSGAIPWEADGTPHSATTPYARRILPGPRAPGRLHALGARLRRRRHLRRRTRRARRSPHRRHPPARSPQHCRRGRRRLRQHGARPPRRRGARRPAGRPPRRARAHGRPGPARCARPGGRPRCARCARPHGRPGCARRVHRGSSRCARRARGGRCGHLRSDPCGAADRSVDGGRRGDLHHPGVRHHRAVGGRHGVVASREQPGPRASGSWLGQVWPSGWGWWG